MRSSALLLKIISILQLTIVLLLSMSQVLQMQKSTLEGGAQTFKDYLNRSMTFLVPEATLANVFSATLGRPATGGDVANMEAAVNAGGSVGTVQWSLAHTPEAADRINDLFQGTLGRLPDAGSLPAWQNRLAATSLSDMKNYLAHSDEATIRLNDIYLQTLNRGIDGVGLQLRQN